MREFKREKKLNNVRVIGKVQSIERIEAESKAGVPVFRGHIMVGYGESVIRVDYYELKTWKNGTMQNDKYNKIAEMSENDIVSLACSLEENKFAGRDGKLVSTQRLNLNFINDVYADSEEGVSFDIIGVVLDPVRAVKNDENEVVNYTIKIGQAPGYQPADGPIKGYSIITLDLQPENTAIVNGAEKHYTTGTTVRVAGHAVSTVEEKVTIVESIFGDDEKKVSQTFDTKFYIDKGLRVMPVEEYNDEDKEYLLNATKEENERIEKEAKEKPAQSKSSSSGAAADGGLAGMLGL